MVSPPSGDRFTTGSASRSWSSSWLQAPRHLTIGDTSCVSCECVFLSADKVTRGDRKVHRGRYVKSVWECAVGVQIICQSSLVLWRSQPGDTGGVGGLSNCIAEITNG